MGRAIRISEIMHEIEDLDLRDELRLLDLITRNVYEKVNSTSKDNQHWLAVSEKSLNKVWDNEQDEVYNELLKR
jgi:hypothetical protein